MHDPGMMRCVLLYPTVIALLFFSVPSPAELLALDNGRIRIEIDTEFFAVRFVGAPGGKNLLAPLHVPQRLRVGGTQSLDPGGLSFHLATPNGDVRVNGPGEVVEQSLDQVMVRSADIGETGVRVRLECSMERGEPACSFKVAMETVSTESCKLGFISRGVLAPEVILRLPKANATIVAAIPDAQAESLLMDAGDYWDVDPDLAPAVEPGMVEVDTAVMEWVGARYALRRTAETSLGGDVAALRLRYRRDAEKRQRVVEWMHPRVEVDLWNQPSIAERWRLETEGD